MLIEGQWFSLGLQNILESPSLSFFFPIVSKCASIVSLQLLLEKLNFISIEHYVLWDTGFSKPPFDIAF